jgi:hypothetical protein
MSNFVVYSANIELIVALVPVWAAYLSRWPYEIRRALVTGGRTPNGEAREKIVLAPIDRGTIALQARFLCHSACCSADVR